MSLAGVEVCFDQLGRAGGNEYLRAIVHVLAVTIEHRRVSPTQPKVELNEVFLAGIADEFLGRETFEDIEQERVVVGSLVPAPITALPGIGPARMLAAERAQLHRVGGAQVPGMVGLFLHGPSIRFFKSRRQTTFWR